MSVHGRLRGRRHGCVRGVALRPPLGLIDVAVPHDLRPGLVRQLRVPDRVGRGRRVVDDRGAGRRRRARGRVRLESRSGLPALNWAKMSVNRPAPLGDAAAVGRDDGDVGVVRPARLVAVERPHRQPAQVVGACAKRTQCGGVRRVETLGRDVVLADHRRRAEVLPRLRPRSSGARPLCRRWRTCAAVLVSADSFGGQQTSGPAASDCAVVHRQRVHAGDVDLRGQRRGECGRAGGGEPGRVDGQRQPDLQGTTGRRSWLPAGRCSAWARRGDHGRRTARRRPRGRGRSSRPSSGRSPSGRPRPARSDRCSRSRVRSSPRRRRTPPPVRRAARSRAMRRSTIERARRPGRSE